jgi:hypothetical protein
VSRIDPVTGISLPLRLTATNKYVNAAAFDGHNLWVVADSSVIKRFRPV